MKLTDFKNSPQVFYQTEKKELNDNLSEIVVKNEIAKHDWAKKKALK